MNSKKGVSPLKKSRTGSGCYGLNKPSGYTLSYSDQQNCLLTDFTPKDIRNYQLLSSDICYHKVYQDILGQIEEVDKKIQEEIKNTQKELKALVQNLVDQEALKPGEDFQLLKIKNNLNLNMIQSQRQGQIHVSQREEIKEMILKKFTKQYAPNFTDEQKLVPTAYHRYIPIDNRNLSKSVQVSTESSSTLDNSYINKINLDEESIKKSHSLVNQEDGFSNIFQNYDNHGLIKYFNQFPDSVQLCLFDFKPINPEFLLLSRLDFMTKSQNIRNYMKNVQRERIDEIQMNHNLYVKLKQQWEANNENEKRASEKQLKLKFPKQYDEFEFEQKHHTGILNQYTGFHHQLLGSAQKNASNQDEDEWDDFQRYRDNKADIPPYRFRFYNVQINHEPYSQLIKDPIEYEMEYKKRQLWSLKEIEIFLRTMLENPKNFWELGKALPHKTLKDLAFFYQMFKKLFNLKKHFNTCHVLMSLPTQAGRKQAIQEIINEVLKPILRYQNEKKGCTTMHDINLGVSLNCVGPNQTFFNVQELLQIYASNSECRRKVKDQDKYLENQQARGLFHFNTHIVPQYKRTDKNQLQSINYFDEIEQRGSKILEYAQEKLKATSSDQISQLTPIVGSATFYINLMQSYKQLMPQKQIKNSQLGQSEKETILKKRSFNEHFMTKDFYSGSGRDISKWIFLKSQYIEEQSFSSKRLKLSSSNMGTTVPVGFGGHQNIIQQAKVETSFTEKYFEERKKQKELMVENEYQNNEETKSSDIGGNANNKQQVVIDIQKDFSNEKEFKNYMENRLYSIFGDYDSEESQESSSNGGNGNNGNGIKQRKGFLQWQEDEKEKFILLLKKHGRDWTAIANELPRKTDKQCRNYFQNYKHKLNLQQYLPEKSKQ